MSINRSRHIHSVIVTHNRRTLLRTALAAHVAQTLRPSCIHIVDNYSTDGTCEMLVAEGWLDREDVELLPLPENTGGAGGFVAGLKRAINSEAEWVWLMDDDAEPRPDALAELMKIANDPNSIYGSLAVAGNETAWELNLLGPAAGKTRCVAAVPDCAEVETLPFLGLLVHRDLVAKIGLPDAGFFIAGDDVEYCVRARRAGAHIIVAGRSHIQHPRSLAQHINLLGRQITHLSLPPWKRYYDTRNRLLIARKHYGARLLTQTIPGSLVRLLAALRNEPRKSAQLHAFVSGFIDGLLCIKGRRHTWWGIA